MYRLIRSRIGSVAIISIDALARHTNQHEEKGLLTERSEEGLSDDLTERSLEQLLLGRDGNITSLLTEASCTVAEQGGWERLRYGHREKGDDTGENHIDPDDPPPADILADETTNNRAKHWAAVRSCGEYCDGKTPLVIVPNIGDRAASESEWRGGEEPTKESTDEERLDVLREGTRDVENDVDDTGDDPYWSTAV